MNEPLFPPSRGSKKTVQPPANQPTPPPASPAPPAPQVQPTQPIYVARAVSVPQGAPNRPAQQVPNRPVQAAPARPSPSAVQPAPGGQPMVAPPVQPQPAIPQPPAPARPVPQFVAPPAQQPFPPSHLPVAQPAPPRTAHIPSQMASVQQPQSAAQQIDAQQFHWEMQRTYAGIRPWLWFIGIIGLLTGMLMLSGVCMVLYASGGQMIAPMVVVCLVILVTASVTMFSSYYIFRYASRMGDYLYGGTRYWLEMTLDAERSMWRFYGVLAILALIISIMAIGLLLAGTLVAVGMGAGGM